MVARLLTHPHLHLRLRLLTPPLCPSAPALCNALTRRIPFLFSAVLPIRAPQSHPLTLSRSSSAPHHIGAQHRVGEGLRASGSRGASLIPGNARSSSQPRPTTSDSVSAPAGAAAASMARRAINGYVDRGADPPADTAEEESLLESFSLIAGIDKAWCRIAPMSKGALDITVQMSQRNLPANRMRKFLSTAHIPEPQGDLSSFYWAPFPVELSGVAAVSPSPTGNRVLCVRNGSTDKNAEESAKAVQLEVWGAGRLLKTAFVAPSTHRSVYTDATFESIAWSDDENSVAYVAEEAAPKPRVLGKAQQEGAAAAPAAAPARGRYGAAAVKQEWTQEGKGEDAAAPGTWKAQGEWKSDWGEQYTGKGRPLLFVLNISEGKVHKVEDIPEDLSVGQVVWAPPVVTTPLPPPQPGAPPPPPPPQTALVFVGWSSTSTNFPTSRQLGLIYCFNRPCALYAVRAPSAGGGGLVKLTSEISSAHNPQFSPDGSLLVFLSSQAAVDSGVHWATNSLHAIRWPGDIPTAPPAALGRGTKAAAAAPGVPSVELPVQTVVPVTPRPEEGTGFPGLYCCSGVVRQPWLQDGRTLLLTTAWRSTAAIVAVHVETGRLTRLTPHGPISWQVLDVIGNAVVAGASTPACPAKLMLGRMNAGFFKQEGWLWSEISTPHVEYAEQVESSLKATEFEVISVPPSAASLRDASTDGAKLPFEAIFVRKALDVPAPPPGPPGRGAPAPPPPPPAGPPPPLVVVPHGGPHSVTFTDFRMPYAFLCSLGFAVLHVNYRGSLGFGEEALQSLPGKIGRQDVDDVLEAIDKVVQQGYADSSRLAVVGGSHGGFLAAHLIGQEPNRFKTAVLRNPVVNLASMSSTSDIPDWVFVDTFGAKGAASYSDVPSAADLDAFLAASPISLAPKMKVPTLFLLGGSDRRVPPSNGLQLAQALKYQGLETKVFLFPEDAHPIEKPQSEFESWVAVASWLKTYL